MIKSGYIASLKDERLRLKLVRKVANVKDDSTLEELMDVAKTEDRITNMLRPMTPIACNEVSVSPVIAAAEQRRDSGRYQHGSQRGGHTHGRSHSVAGQAKQENPWCAIHETRRHDISECHFKDATECKYCREQFKVGEYADHIAKCTGRRCHECNRLGHIARYCKRRIGNETSTTAKRQRQHSGSTGDATTSTRTNQNGKETPRRGAAVAAATSEPVEVQTEQDGNTETN
jgi:hypothetical protein